MDDPYRMHFLFHSPPLTPSSHNLAPEWQDDIKYDSVSFRSFSLHLRPMYLALHLRNAATLAAIMDGPEPRGKGRSGDK